MAREERHEDVTITVERKTLRVTCDLTGKELATVLDGRPIACPEPCVEFTPHLYIGGERVNTRHSVALTLTDFRRLFGADLTTKLFPPTTEGASD